MSPEAGYLPKRRLRHSAAVAIAAAASVAALLATAAEPPAAAPPPLYPVRIDHAFANPEESFREVVSLVREHYYTDAIDDTSIWWAATRGLLRHLSPNEHPDLATIWRPDQFEDVSDSLQGLRESIGIRSSFNPNDGSLTIGEVTPGGPSEGILQPLDRILRIDGRPLKGLTVAAVMALLEGEPDTPVALTVVRDVEVLDLTVRREKFRLQNVIAQAFPDRIGYLAIRAFSQGVSERCREELSGLTEKGCAGLILDLRGNGGGVLQEGLRTAELFLPKGQSIMRVVSHGGKISNFVSAATTTVALPLAVLVDKQTASAAEILAAALADDCGATVVGSPTYGKASMERIFTLQNSYRVKFTTGAIYSPKGRSWHGRGLQPQVHSDLDSATLERSRALTPAARLLHDPPLRAAHHVLTHGRSTAAAETAPAAAATAPRQTAPAKDGVDE